MKGFLQWLYLFAVAIGLQVVAEREAYRYIRVSVLQSKEILTAYPSVLIVETALECLYKCFRHHRVYVVDMDMLILVL